MKEVTVTIAREEIEELVRDHLQQMFPTLEIRSVLGLGYSDVTVRLARPLPIEAAPEQPLPFAIAPINDPDESPF